MCEKLNNPLSGPEDGLLSPSQAIVFLLLNCKYYVACSLPIKNTLMCLEPPQWRSHGGGSAGFQTYWWILHCSHTWRVFKLYWQIWFLTGGRLVSFKYVGGYEQKIVWGFIQDSKVIEEEQSNGKKVMLYCCKMICRPCNNVSYRHCIIKYKSLSYSCINIEHSLVLWVLNSLSVEPARRIWRLAGCSLLVKSISSSGDRHTYRVS